MRCVQSSCSEAFRGSQDPVPSQRCALRPRKRGGTRLRGVAAPAQEREVCGGGQGGASDSSHHPLWEYRADGSRLGASFGKQKKGSFPISVNQSLFAKSVKGSLDEKLPRNGNTQTNTPTVGAFFRRYEIRRTAQSGVCSSLCALGPDPALPRARQSPREVAEAAPVRRRTWASGSFSDLG